MKCPACHREVPGGSRFCSSCGIALDLAGAPAAGIRVPRPEAERRQLTVLFCDLVGSTELAGRIDPEELREVVRRYQRSVAQVVKRLAGNVAHYLGDGIVAYFGYPEASEDDAARAVRAGLGMLEAIRNLNLEIAADGGAHFSAPIELAVRIGVHTGPVVVGEVGSDEHVETMALGETPNLAARLQSLAQPNTVVVSAATHDLVAGLFVVEDEGSHTLKGIAEPVFVYRILRASGARSRLQAAATRGLTPLVGRRHERDVLLARWRDVRAGRGRLAIVVGEPGIGKSRLVQALREHVIDGGEPHRWIECGGARVFQNTPFHPVTELLRQMFTPPSEEPAAQIARLERSLAQAGLDLEDALPVVASLLSLPLPPTYPPMLTAADQQRRKLLDVLTAWLLGTARAQPLVVVVEDLQWIDPSTLDLQARIAEHGEEARLLLLCTARPEFRAAWPSRRHHTHVKLERLNHAETREIVRRVAAAASAPPGDEARGAVPDEVTEAVVRRSEGVPLFAEELARLMVERAGSRPLGSDATARTARPLLASGDIPATLQDSPMARLDRLGPAKEVAQIGAVLGREFTYDLLRAVAPVPEPALRLSLEQLAAADLLFPRGSPPDAAYVFKHALVQDTAYASLLKSRRRELHGTIARLLIERFPETVEAHPELVAHHHTEAGDAAPAAAAWQQAGLKAVKRSAHREAVAHLEEGLSVLRGLPAGPERAHQELVMQVYRGSALEATAGYGSPDATEAFARARELGDEHSESFPFIFVLLGLWASMTNRGEVHSGLELANQIRRRAELDGTATQLVWGHFACGVTLLYRGDPAGARDQLESALASYDSKDHKFVPADPGVSALGFLSIALWQLGFADQAQARLQQVMELARRLQKPYERAWAHVFAGSLSVASRDPRRALDHSEALLELSTQEHFPVLRAIATMVGGWATAASERSSEGPARLRDGLAAYLATGQRLNHAFYLGLLADAYSQAGLFREARATIEDALAAGPEETLHRADHLRMRADILLRLGDRATAEEGYREALSVAAAQGTRAYALRIATRWAHLLAVEGRTPEARQLLASHLAGFTEGFATRDLREAKSLLDDSP